MSSKLDQSLEDISKSRRQSGRANRRRSGAAKAAATKAPVGGIKKNTKAVRAPTKSGAIGPSSPVNESKIIVSGLVRSISFNADAMKDMLTKPLATRCRRKQYQGTLIDGLPMALGFYRHFVAKPLRRVRFHTTTLFSCPCLFECQHQTGAPLQRSLAPIQTRV